MQPPPVLEFPDVIADMCRLLRDDPALAGVNITATRTTLTAGRPSVFIERAAGQRDRFFDSPYLIFEVRAGSDDRAWDITNRVRGLLFAATSRMGWTNMFEVGGPSFFADLPESDPFYRFTLSVTVRASKTSALPPSRVADL